ncbi:hypothetical protein BJ741DRAFT_649306 [Chytriomyces cf. hyalinus JEL632]|nr:hypothetical protein BJ741DRAFT_649306 [Chytriomyces cf. hyalinus JEL632]
MPNSTVWVSAGLAVGLILTALAIAALSRWLHRSRNADVEIPPVREMEVHSNRNRVGTHQAQHLNSKRAVSLAHVPQSFSTDQETHQFLAARGPENIPPATHSYQKQTPLNDPVDPAEPTPFDEQVEKLKDPVPQPTQYQLPNSLTGIKSRASIFASTASLSNSRASNLNSVYGTPTSSVGSIFANTDLDPQADDISADVQPGSLQKKALFFSASSLLERDA